MTELLQNDVSTHSYNIIIVCNCSIKCAPNEGFITVVSIIHFNFDDFILKIFFDLPVYLNCP